MLSPYGRDEAVDEQSLYLMQRARREENTMAAPGGRKWIWGVIFSARDTVMPKCRDMEVPTYYCRIRTGKVLKTRLLLFFPLTAHFPTRLVREIWLSRL